MGSHELFEIYTGYHTKSFLASRNCLPRSPYANIQHTMFTVILASGLSLVSLSLLAIAADKKRRTAQLPPGPPRNWILGNLLDLLKTDDLLALVDSWQDAYGRLIFLYQTVR